MELVARVVFTPAQFTCFIPCLTPALLTKLCAHGKAPFHRIMYTCVAQASSYTSSHGALWQFTSSRAGPAKSKEQQKVAVSKPVCTFGILSACMSLQRLDSILAYTRGMCMCNWVPSSPYLGQDVGPSNTGQTTDSPAGSEARPALSGVQGVPGDGAAGQGLHAQGHGGLELGRAVDGQAQSQDQDQASTGHAASNLSNALNVAQGAQLQEQHSMNKHVNIHSCRGNAVE